MLQYDAEQRGTVQRDEETRWTALSAWLRLAHLAPHRLHGVDVDDKTVIKRPLRPASPNEHQAAVLHHSQRVPPPAKSPTHRIPIVSVIQRAATARRRRRSRQARGPASQPPYRACARDAPSLGRSSARVARRSKAKSLAGKSKS
eukprot:6889754-Pyramimonas_sp.AAC.4